MAGSLYLVTGHTPQIQPPTNLSLTEDELGQWMGQTYTGTPSEEQNSWLGKGYYTERTVSPAPG